MIAHLENGRLPSEAKVERCDQCCRYADDASARQKLVELGLVWPDPPVMDRYTVHVYATVRVTFGELEAPSHEAAARLADELFDWDQHKERAEYADEITEYLVDLEGDLGCARSRRAERRVRGGARLSASCSNECQETRRVFEIPPLEPDLAATVSAE